MSTNIKLVQYDDDTPRNLSAHDEVNCGSVPVPEYEGYTFLGCLGGYGNGAIGAIVYGNKWVYNTKDSTLRLSSIVWYYLYSRS